MRKSYQTRGSVSTVNTNFLDFQVCVPYPLSVSAQLQLLPLEPKSYAYRAQMEALIKACGDGQWRSLAQIEIDLAFHYSQTGISARLRDLRRGVPGFERWTSERKTESERRNFYRIVGKANSAPGNGRS